MESTNKLIKENFDIKLIKSKHKFFLKQNKFNILKICLLISTCILLFLLVLFVSVNKIINVSEAFKLNFNYVLQMVITGFNLGAATFILQKITRNRLADPSIMGLGNISLIPVTVLVLFTDISLQNKPNMISEQTMLNLIPIIVLITSILFITMFHFFSKEGTKLNYKKMIIAGVLINFVSVAIAYSITPLLNYSQKPIVENFIKGFIKTIPDANILYFSIAISIAMNIWMLLIAKKLQVSITNQEIATQLGINNSSVMFQALICIVSLVSSSYMLSGDFVFVGLLAANLSTMLFKNKIIEGYFGSGLFGIIIVLLTYFVFKNLIQLESSIIPLMIPLMIGPFFLFLLIRGK